MKMRLCLIIICILSSLSLSSQNRVIELDFARKKQPEAKLYILSDKDSISLTSIDKNVFIYDFSEDLLSNVNCERTILIQLEKHFLLIDVPCFAFECRNVKIKIERAERYLLSYCGSYGISGIYQVFKMQDGRLIEQRKNKR